MSKGRCQGCKHWTRKPDLLRIEVSSYRYKKDSERIFSCKYLKWAWEDDAMAHHYWRGKADFVVKSRTRAVIGDCDSEGFYYTGAGGHADDDAKTPANSLGYSDGEACQAYFHTGEDFGCVHWEERDG